MTVILVIIFIMDYLRPLALAQIVAKRVEMPSLTIHKHGLAQGEVWCPLHTPAASSPPGPGAASRATGTGVGSGALQQVRALPSIILEASSRRRGGAKLNICSQRGSQETTRTPPSASWHELLALQQHFQLLSIGKRKESRTFHCIR